MDLFSTLIHPEQWLFKFFGKPQGWILLVLIIILSLGYRAWRSRIRRASHQFTMNDTSLVFKSQLGTFIFDTDKRTFTASYVNKEPIEMGFINIQNIEIIPEEATAMLQEIFLEEWNPFWDTLPEYTDVVRSYTIAVITPEYKRYPIITMSQYIVKDFFLSQMFIDAQLDILSVFGLYVPLDYYVRKLYSRFEQKLDKEFKFERDKLPYTFET